MIKDVIIKIKGTQEIDGNTETIELTTDGRFGFKDGKYFFSYEERQPTDNLLIKTQVFVTPPDSFVIQRSGTVSSRMEMQKGKKNSCFYSMPEGSLLIGVYTEKVDIDLCESGGTMKAVYTLDSGMKIISRNTVKITVKEV